MKVGSALPRRVLAQLGILGLILASTIFTSPVIIAQQDASSDQKAATQSNNEGLPPLPLSPIEKAEKDGTALRLSLKEVTKLALQNNLDIAIQDTNEQLSRQKIAAAYGNYDPTLDVKGSVSSQKSANTNLASQSTSGSFNKQDSANWGLTFAQNVKTGGSINANWDSRRSDNNQAFSLFTPQYNSGITVSFTQPLFRNFRIDQTRGNIKLVKLDLESTDSKFKQRVTEIISNVQQQYWDLVSAINDYDIKRSSVKLGQITLRDNTKKVEVGTMAPIVITEAKANLAARELNLISSEETILRQENALRQLITNNRNAEIWSKVIIPTDSPEITEYKIALNTAIETALAKRPELEQYDIQLKQSDINIKLTDNSRKWKVDATGQFGSNGVAGPQGYRLGVPQVPEPLIGGIGNAYKTIFTEGYTNWQISLSVNIPLRSRNLDSQYAQQQIQKKQTLINRSIQEQTVQVEIRNAVQKLETNKKQVETAKMNLQLSQEQLEGETKRNEAGLSENFRVLDRQDQLAQAQNTYLVNIINYKKSVIALQKAMYTLLESNDFELAKGNSSKVPNLK